MSEADWRELVCGWFPELVDTGLRQTSWPVIECHRDYIAAQLKVGVTAATIHQRLADEHGLAVSVASVRRWVAANLPEEARRAVGLPDRDGLLVRGVQDGSPAAAAGIQTGDLIVAAGGDEVTGVDSLHAVIDGTSADGELAIVVVRGNDEHELSVAFGQGEEEAA